MARGVVSVPDPDSPEGMVTIQATLDPALEDKTKEIPRGKRKKYYDPIFPDGHIKTPIGYPTLHLVHGVLEPKNLLETELMEKRLRKHGGPKAVEQWQGDNFPEDEEPERCLCGFETRNIAAWRAHRRRWPDHHKLRPTNAVERRVTS